MGLDCGRNSRTDSLYYKSKKEFYCFLAGWEVWQFINADGNQLYSKSGLSGAGSPPNPAPPPEFRRREPLLRFTRRSFEERRRGLARAARKEAEGRGRPEAKPAQPPPSRRWKSRRRSAGAAQEETEAPPGHGSAQSSRGQRQPPGRELKPPREPPRRRAGECQAPRRVPSALGGLPRLAQPLRAEQRAGGGSARPRLQARSPPPKRPNALLAK